MPPVAEGQVLTGAQFAELVRVETIKQVGPVAWEIGVSGINTQKFRKVTLSAEAFNGTHGGMKPGSREEPSTRLHSEQQFRDGTKALIDRYPRLSTDRETADRARFEWITPGHALFEALWRYAWDETREACANGAPGRRWEVKGRQDRYLEAYRQRHYRTGGGAAFGLALPRTSGAMAALVTSTRPIATRWRAQ